MLDLKTEWIRYFIILADSNNFTDAAKKLDISVSALTQSINNLEKSLKFKIINRNTKGNLLTNKGSLFLEKSQKFVNGLANIELFIKNETSPREEIRIGWSNFWGSYILPDMIKKTSEKFPDIYPKIYGFSVEEASLLIMENKLDMAIITGKIDNQLNIEQSLCFLEGKKVKILNVKSAERSEIKATISSFGRKNDDFDIEVANLSTLIFLLKELDIQVKIPSIIYEKLDFKDKLFIEDNLNDSITPYLIWNKNLKITKVKKYFIETFMDCQ